MKKTICALFVFIFLVSCSTSEIGDTNEEVLINNQIESTNANPIEQEIFSGEFSVLVTVKAINIRSSPSTENKDNKIGLACMGETYTVFEQTRDSKYTWYRIGDDKWIANDGTWCIEYGNEENKNFPHIMNYDEIQKFLSSLETGSHCLSSLNGNETNLLNIFSDDSEYRELFGCNIVFSTDERGTFNSYRYDVSNVAVIDDNTFDVYVVPVENDGYVDCSTGCFRFTNIGTFIADGNINDKRLRFDLTLIQNNNDVSDEYLNNLYSIEQYYVLSGQISF